MTEPFPPVATRAAALARLAAFAPHAGEAYARTRNTDLGPARRENVSLLSPYLRHRMITEEEVLAAVRADDKDDTTEAFVAEVFWRGYFKGWLETRPSIWTDYLAQVTRGAADLAANAGLRKAYDQAIAGRTGIDAFDAFAEELVETGYLHNHARMWFASIWIFTLNLPWALGADHTLRHFIDGDPASNTLSWRWVGGLQTRGKTYLARRDNIATFTGGRFDPEGLATMAVPLEELMPPAPLPLPAAAKIAPAGRVGLLLHADDLHPESLPLGQAEVVAVMGAHVADANATYLQAAIPKHFTRDVLHDALARASDWTGTPLEPDTALDLDTLRDFARRHDLATIVTPYAPVGDIASRLDAIQAQLDGVSLVRIRRNYDTLTWPHATKGFFQMRRHIPAIVESLGTRP